MNPYWHYKESEKLAEQAKVELTNLAAVVGNEVAVDRPLEQIVEMVARGTDYIEALAAIAQVHATLSNFSDKTYEYYSHRE